MKIEFLNTVVRFYAPAYVPSEHNRLFFVKPRTFSMTMKNIKGEVFFLFSQRISYFPLLLFYFCNLIYIEKFIFGLLFNIFAEFVFISPYKSLYCSLILFNAP